jgi:hypothetical protein
MKSSLLLLLLSGCLFGGDDFSLMLKRVESHYGKNHMRIPFLGVVTFASHLTRPMGASDFKLAVIEGTRASDVPDFEPGGDWRAFLRTTSRDGGHTVMYGREEGPRAIRALMLVIDKDEAVVMQMRLDPGRFAKMLAEKAGSK